MDISGGCHCGAVTYEARIDPTKVTICHCTDCQKLTGTAFRVSVLAPREDIRLTGQEPQLYQREALTPRKQSWRRSAVTWLGQIDGLSAQD